MFSYTFSDYVREKRVNTFFVTVCLWMSILPMFVSSSFRPELA